MVCKTWGWINQFGGERKKEKKKNPNAEKRKCVRVCNIHHNTNLLKLKNVLIEVVLKVFIGIVDTKLLKTVSAKILKAKYVQNAN